MSLPGIRAVAWIALLGCSTGTVESGSGRDAGEDARADAGSGRDAAPADGAVPCTEGCLDSGSTPTDSGGPPADETDCFGTRAIYPLAGREWCLPDEGHVESGSWRPDDDVSAGSMPGVVRSEGSPRHSVRSLEGEAWWRNVEMTVYLRHVSGDDEYTLYARGGRHTRGTASPDEVDEGVVAPAGTVAWPGYPFDGSVTWNCIGTAYKGNLDVAGNVFFRKEISHTAGYTPRAGEVAAIPEGIDDGRWVGFKLVVRNYDDDAHVHLEAWLDRAADGTWELVSSYDDEGGWEGDPAADGCDEAPFGYTQDQIITWAGPTAVLRTDASTFDFRAFSVREIAPLP